MKRAIGMGLMAAVLVLASALPSHADGHRPSGHAASHRAAWHPRGPHVVLAPHVYPRSYYWGAGYSPVMIQPPVYLEPAPPAPTTWYYCPAPAGYYPYVQVCPGGWMTVLSPGS